VESVFVWTFQGVVQAIFVGLFVLFAIGVAVAIGFTALVDKYMEWRRK
jgi:5-bromo-4-chloroindolyl phosphate hydrolysis protein